MIRVLCLAFLILAGSIALSEQPDSQHETSGSTSLAELLSGDTDVQVLPILTDSPRRTLDTFLRLRADLEKSLLEYGKTRTVENYARIRFLHDQFLALIDLEDMPAAKREKIGSETAFYLLDTLGRVDEIDTTTVPSFEAVDDTQTKNYRLPGTPFQILMMTEGPRNGEFLFSSSTI